jgi:hypothetical protein
MNEDSQERAAMDMMKVKSVNVLSRALKHDGTAALHQAARLATHCNFQSNIARDVCNDKSPSSLSTEPAAHASNIQNSATEEYASTYNLARGFIYSVL